MKQALALIGACLLASCQASPPPLSPESRAIEFDRLIWSGAVVELEEWFAPGMEQTHFVKTFGGPQALAAHSKERSDREGGIKNIEVVSTRSLSAKKLELEMRTTFQSGEITESLEIWELINGKWRLALPQSDDLGP